MTRQEFLENVYNSHVRKHDCITSKEVFVSNPYACLTHNKETDVPTFLGVGFFMPKNVFVRPRDSEMEVAHLSNMDCRGRFFSWKKVRCYTIKNDEVIEREPHRRGKCPYCKYEEI